MVMVIVGVVLLASGKDVLVLVSWYVFIFLGWISAYGSTSYSGHGFLSNPYKQHQMYYQIKWIGTNRMSGVT